MAHIQKGTLGKALEGKSKGAALKGGGKKIGKNHENKGPKIVGF